MSRKKKTISLPLVIFLLSLIATGLDAWIYWNSVSLHRTIGLPKGDAIRFYLVTDGMSEGKNLTGRIKVYNQSRDPSPVTVHVQTYDQFNRVGSIARGEFVCDFSHSNGKYNGTEQSELWTFSIRTPVASEYYFVLNYGFSSACTTELEYSILSFEPQRTYEILTLVVLGLLTVGSGYLTLRTKK